MSDQSTRALDGKDERVSGTQQRIWEVTDLSFLAENLLLPESVVVAFAITNIN
jgi:hypothetical protein